MSNSNTPMDYGEAVWRTAEIRMYLSDFAKELESASPQLRVVMMARFILELKRLGLDEVANSFRDTWFGGLK